MDDDFYYATMKGLDSLNKRLDKSNAKMDNKLNRDVSDVKWDTEFVVSRIMKNPGNFVFSGEDRKLTEAFIRDFCAYGALKRIGVILFHESHSDLVSQLDAIPNIVHMGGDDVLYEPLEGYGHEDANDRLMRVSILQGDAPLEKEASRYIDAVLTLMELSGVTICMENLKNFPFNDGVRVLDACISKGMVPADREDSLRLALGDRDAAEGAERFVDRMSAMGLGRDGGEGRHGSLRTLAETSCVITVDVGSFGDSALISAFLEEATSTTDRNYVFMFDGFPEGSSDQYLSFIDAELPNAIGVLFAEDVFSHAVSPDRLELLLGKCAGWIMGRHSRPESCRLVSLIFGEYEHKTIDESFENSTSFKFEKNGTVTFKGKLPRVKPEDVLNLPDGFSYLFDRDGHIYRMRLKIK